MTETIVTENTADNNSAFATTNERISDIKAALSCAKEAHEQALLEWNSRAGEAAGAEFVRFQKNIDGYENMLERCIKREKKHDGKKGR